jgi:hypothetical protein
MIKIKGPVEVEFNDSAVIMPKELNVVDDLRYFLFVKDGTPYCGYFKNGNFFDMNDISHGRADGWVEWQEVVSYS